MNFYSNQNYNLTEKESVFVQKFLDNNGCCANNPGDLLADNFSCQTIEDMEKFGFTKHQVHGLISSLMEKEVIFIEKRDGAKANTKNYITFEPDLYWINDEYLESLPEDLDFAEEVS
jgi:hypothetical protein